MNDERHIRDSKHLSFLLRHDKRVPHDNYGWVRMDDLMSLSRFDRERLFEIIGSDTRYELSQDGECIRAHHGHSVDVEYDRAVIPPEVLYHGTTQEGLSGIRSSGRIEKRRRTKVHLTGSVEYAHEVGNRRYGTGRAVVLRIDSKRMHDDGHTFYLSGDGVYLVEEVPLDYIEVLDQTDDQTPNTL